LNEACDPEGITSLVKKHISDARLTTQSEERLVYILPLERTNKFPGNPEQVTRLSGLRFSHLYQGKGSRKLSEFVLMVKLSCKTFKPIIKMLGINKA
jgi:hypothetical protein